MKNILLRDEEGGIHFYAGNVVSESDLDALEAVLDRLFGKMRKLENQAPTPDGTRSCTLGNSIYELLKRIEEGTDEKRDNRKRIETAEKMIEVLWQNGIKANRRIRELEEFVGDM